MQMYQSTMSNIYSVGACNTKVMGKRRTDKSVIEYLEMQCKSLWIKVPAKCINVNVNRLDKPHLIFYKRSVHSVNAAN